MAGDRDPRDLWKHRDGHAPARRETGAPVIGRKAARAFVALAVLLALAGVVVGLLFYLRPPPRPVFVSIAVTEYADRNWPVNPFARQDGDALRERFGSDSVQAFQSQERALVLAELNRLADATRRSEDAGRPVVVHLSALGLVHAGRVHLLPGTARANEPSTWLPLGEVLQALRRAEGPRLLLLDVRPFADARLGVLAEDVADAVHAELTKAAEAGELPYRVLASCGPGQVPQASPELRHSVFGFFLEQGTRGHADGWNAAGHRDDRVSALELAAYARAQVARWAELHGAPPQTPTLYGQGSDFTLVALEGGTPPPLPDPEPADEYPPWLPKGWQERDAWLADGSHRRTPRTFRHLEAILLRAEERWLGGSDLGAVQRDLETEMGELQKQKQSYAPPPMPIRSIVAAARQKPKAEPDAAQMAVLRKLLETIKATPAPDPKALPELAKPLWAKPPEAEPFDAVAAAIFAAAVEINDPTVEQLRALNMVARGFEPPPKHAELMALRFLAEQDPKLFQRWSRDKDGAGTARLVLRATQLGERAAAIDGRCLPWLSKALADADARRREGIVKLVSGGTTVREEARSQLAECLREYQRIVDAAKTLEQGFFQFDESLGLLPGLAGHPPLTDPADPNPDAAWAGTVAETRALFGLLAPPATPGFPPTAELGQHDTDLRVRRVRLLESYAVPPAIPPAEIRRWLDSPVWPADQRSRLAAKARDAAHQLAKEALRRAASLPVQLDVPAANRPSPPALAARRARRALDALALAGLDEVAEMEPLYARASAGNDPGAWRELGERIGAAWSVRLPERYRTATDPAARERIGRFVHPFDLAALPSTGDPFPRDPTPGLRRAAELAFVQWLGEQRYRRDARALRAVQDNPAAAAYAKALDELAEICLVSH